jgi:cyclopropane fatty-acyl-phospholipid synthase-like methyltransferase
MAVEADPEHNETRALFDLVELANRRVLEVGSGDGRLTWRYAGLAAHVTAVEPSAASMRQAKEALPDSLRGRVAFHNSPLDGFAAGSQPALFDVALLSWSL